MNLNSSFPSKSKKGASKREVPTKFKKAPGAPRRFKSAYIFFSTQKHKEIRLNMGKAGEKEKTTNVAKMVSNAWKNLPSAERDYWEDMARRDKERYEMEKSMYNGPWKVPVEKVAKDPNAPKRPMSAFLSYSNSKRSEVKKLHQGKTNAEVSRILASMWKEAKDEDKKSFIDHEFKLRQEYKTAIAEWRANAEQRKEAQREEREQMAFQTLEAHKQQMESTAGMQLPTTSPLLSQLQLGRAAAASFQARAAPSANLATLLNVAQDSSALDAGASLDTWGNPNAFGAAASALGMSMAGFGASAPAALNPYLAATNLYSSQQQAHQAGLAAQDNTGNLLAAFNTLQQQQAELTARLRAQQQQEQGGQDNFRNIFDPGF